MRYFTHYCFVFGVLVLLAVSCATPTSPTGGEPDQEGPVITNTEPESGTTNFGDDEISISFSEFIERQSLRDAIIIEPDIGISYSLDWGRRSVSIEFDGALPDTTTILVTIGTELTDTRGNEMSEPVRIAVSTGPEIDEGQIFGRVIDARTGDGSSGDRVLLYRSPFDLSQPADYIAQTDTSGRFNFTYLRQGSYKVFWVDDVNRSKIWEQGRERAQPFYRETLTLERAGQDTLRTIYKAQSDTTSPAIQGVGLFSTRRLRLRFSENIQLTDSSSIVINDTLGNSYANAFPLYISTSDQYVLFGQSGADLEEDQSYQLAARNISDISGNISTMLTSQFDGSAQEDTTQQRIIKQENSTGIYPDEPIEIVYAKPISDSAVVDSLVVIEGENSSEGWENAEIEENRLLVFPDGSWEEGTNYEVRAWNPITSQRKAYPVNAWFASNLGGIEFSIADTTDSRTYRLQVSSDERGTEVDTTFTGSIQIEELPPLDYRAIIYADLNNNNRWDEGLVTPFESPEPYFIQNNIPVERSFTSEVTISFE